MHGPYLTEVSSTTVCDLMVLSVSSLSLSFMIRSRIFSRATIVELDSEGSIVSTFT